MSLKKISILSLLILSASLTGAKSAVVLSTFGNSINGDLTGSWASGYNSTTSTVTANDSSGSGISYFLSSGSWNITGLNQISLTSAVTTNPSSEFLVDLYDGNGSNQGVLQAAFSWSSFGTTQTTVTESLTKLTSSFDYTDVIGWDIVTQGVSANSLTVSFNELQAVAAPEPSAMILLGLGLCALVVCRSSIRRRVQA